MRAELQLWARSFVVLFDWRERGTWFNTRMRHLERIHDAIKHDGYELMEGRGPYTLDDIDKRVATMKDRLDALRDELAATVEMRAIVDAERRAAATAATRAADAG